MFNYTPALFLFSQPCGVDVFDAIAIILIEQDAKKKTK